MNIPKIGVAVMVLKDNKVLLGRRKSSHESDTWSFPEGHLDHLETISQCALRKVREETEMDVELKSNEPVAVNEYMMEGNKHYVSLYMLAEHISGEPHVMEPDKYYEWDWFEWENLPQPLFTPIKKLIETGYNPLRIEKDIEVEVQSFITKEKYEQLLEFFKRNATQIKDDYQETFYFDIGSNFRVQKNNDSAKLWHKSGGVHDEMREEIEINLDRNDFEKLEKLLNKIGHEVKIKWFRKRNQFDWNGIIVSIDYTKGYGYILEMEIMSSELDKEKNLEMLKKRFHEMEIPITPKEEFERKYANYAENWEVLVREDELE